VNAALKDPEPVDRRLQLVALGQLSAAPPLGETGEGERTSSTDSLAYFASPDV
jgi:hypothetical protein